MGVPVLLPTLLLTVRRAEEILTSAGATTLHPRPAKATATEAPFERPHSLRLGVSSEVFLTNIAALHVKLELPYVSKESCRSLTFGGDVFTICVA